MERKEVIIGSVKVGNGQKIAIQSMTNTQTNDISATIYQVKKLQAMGCDIVRISLPDLESAKNISRIIEKAEIPIVADVHFDYRIALEAISSGVHKLRINPSNFPIQKLREVVHAAKSKNVPIRVGVNKGSIHKTITDTELAEYALSNVLLLEKLGFENIVVSAKTSEVKDCINVNRYIYNHCPYPIHIGLTEAGPGKFAEIKSIYAMSVLLSEGIGDTLRISLTGSPIREVAIAKDILRASGARDDFLEIVSCPTCARTNIEVEKISKTIEKKFAKLNKKIRISIMGCSVNGIGEAIISDIGVCGGIDSSALFFKGKKIRTIKNEDILTNLVELIEKYYDND